MDNRTETWIDIGDTSHELEDFMFYVIRYKSGGWIMAQYMPDGWYVELPVAGRVKVKDFNPVVAYLDIKELR